MDETTYQRELRKAKRKKTITNILVLLSVIGIMNYVYYIISMAERIEFDFGMATGISILVVIIGTLIIKQK